MTLALLAMIVEYTYQACTNTQFEQTVDGVTSCVECFKPCSECTSETVCTLCAHTEMIFNAGGKPIFK
jgi:hypothetical protein